MSDYDVTRRRPATRYTCEKCGRSNSTWWTFGTKKGKYYCLDHIPLRVRFLMWIRRTP